MRIQVYPFGLSAEQFANVTREMLGVARLVCRHSGASPGDAVQQAFVKALSKPSAERPSIENEEKFVAWMCELTKYEALTNRNSYIRRREEAGLVRDISELVTVPPSVGAVEARKMLQEAFMRLAPADQALLHALYAQETTIEEIASEQNISWSTVDSRRRRILDLLYVAIRAVVAALVLLPKRAQAFVARSMQQAPHMLVQATQFGGAMTVTVVCGVLVPSGSPAMTAPPVPVGLTPYGTPETIAAQVAPLPPALVPEVVPEEPKVLDTVADECSAARMRSAKIATYLQQTVIPFAFLVAPAVTQLACAGASQQTPPNQPVDASDEEVEPNRNYEIMCANERRRGDPCPTKEEWDARHR